MNMRDRRVTSLVLSLPLLYGTSMAAEYTTFIGDANPYQVARVLADSSGNTYIAGTRLLNESSDVFVTKLDPSGNTLFFQAISGKGTDAAADMGIDSAGNIYVGGSTSSTAFPIHNALQSKPGPGFLLKLSADASELLWSTYFQEAITALAVDSNGNVYITGTTGNPDFPVTAGLPKGQELGGVPPVYGAFLTKISAAGNSIVYSAVMSGFTTLPCSVVSIESCANSPRGASGISVAVDAAGNAYLAGNTDTSDMPTTSSAFLTTGMGPFVAKVKADGSGLSYLTYISATEFLGLPANSPSTATAIACDAQGNAYLTGTTFDPNFPVTKEAFETTYHGPALPTSLSPPFPPVDAFALKLNPTGSGLVWGTYLGGSADDVADAIAVDASNQVWLAGTTASPDFPNAQGWSTTGGDFISGIEASGANLVYSARYPNGGASRSISVDPSGLLHVSGPSGIVSTISPGSSPLPRVWGVANAANGPLDGRVAPGEVISLYGPHIGPASPVAAVPDSSGNLPTSLSGYQVVAGARPIPLLYASDSQINAVLSFLSPGPISVSSAIGSTPGFPLIPVRARLEIFHNPDGSAIALNQDGTLNAADNPALAGSTVSIWTTGSGVNVPGLDNTGQIATTSINYIGDFCCGVELNGQYTPITYAATSPGSIVGIMQLDFELPSLDGISSLGTSLPLQAVASDGSLSLPVMLYVIPASQGSLRTPTAPLDTGARRLSKQVPVKP
jgi:uncharacterized protein (TIGR03437 family)